MIIIKRDFELIVHKFPTDTSHINIYPIGDTQVGSPNFNEKLWRAWKDEVMADDAGYVVMVGDMINNGLKHSKTNVYGEVMRPFQQKEWLTNELKPMADKILGAVRGNHEKRSANEVDYCPMYDVMAKINKEDLYRENMAFIKINLGQRTSARQCSYILALGHGQGVRKTENFGYALDGVDVFITGHTHNPKSIFPAKVVVDSHNEVVRVVDFTHIVVPSFDEFGGYTLEGMYMPQSSTKVPRITLDGTEKGVSVLWK